MTDTAIFGQPDLDALTTAARASDRRRRNRNFHAVSSHPAQRLLNAIEPDSYVQPHRHRLADRDETIVMVRGAVGIVVFDEDGRITRTAVLRAGGENVGAHLPANTFHTLVALEPGSVFFEAKAGPYDAATDKELAPWSPAEGAAEAMAYHAQLRTLF